MSTKVFLQSNVESAVPNTAKNLNTRKVSTAFADTLCSHFQHTFYITSGRLSLPNTAPPANMKGSSFLYKLFYINIMCQILLLRNAAASKFSIDMIRRWISHFQWKICWANIVLQSPESIKLEIEEKFLFNGSTTFAGRMHSSKSRIYSTGSK